MAKCRIPFYVTVALTADLVFRIIFGAFLNYLRGIQNLVCGCILGRQSVMYLFCDLDLISRIIVSGPYLVYCLGMLNFYGYIFGGCVAFHFYVAVILT